MALLVCETFVSILGESTHAGLPAFFLRLAGCNLDCHYCDTVYAREEGEPRLLPDLVEAARVQGTGRVLVTGGEPLLQNETPALLDALVAAGCQVLLETNGSLPITGINNRVHRIVDVKCPGSGMAARNYWPNLEGLTPLDEVKFVVADEADFAYAIDVIREYRLLDQAPVLISPAFGVLPPARAAAMILETRLPLRLNLQLHKYIWDPQTRGV